MIRIFKKLIIISINLFFAGGLIMSIIGYINKFQQQYPVIKLKLLGELDYIDQKDIELLLGDLLLNNLWTLNLNVVKDKLMLNSWVDKLILKKCWPNKLEVSIIYNKPIAVWNDNFFLTASGKILYSTKNELKLKNLNLPKFYGETGKENLLLNTYLLLLEKLSSIGLLVERLDFKQDQGIVALLNNNIKLKLGTFDLSDRIMRFIVAYKKKLSPSISDISYIDLRYTNGVAVAWILKDMNVE